MTLACGKVGSEATLVSGGGRRAEPLAEPLASPPPEVERERTRPPAPAPGGSRACKFITSLHALRTRTHL